MRGEFSLERARKLGFEFWYGGIARRRIRSGCRALDDGRGDHPDDVRVG